MPHHKTRSFHAKPAHIAVCHAFGEEIDRRRALSVPYRAQLTLEHCAIGAALDAMARVATRFAETLDRLDADRTCNLSLQSNILLMTHEARAGLSTTYGQARRLSDAASAPSGPLQAKLAQPVGLPCAIDRDRFDALCALRREVHDLMQDLCARLTRLYYDAPQMTIGALCETLHRIAHDARGQVYRPVLVEQPLLVAA